MHYTKLKPGCVYQLISSQPSESGLWKHCTVNGNELIAFLQVWEYVLVVETQEVQDPFLKPFLVFKKVLTKNTSAWLCCTREYGVVEPAEFRLIYESL